MDADGYLFQYVCSKKEYPAPESGRDAAKPAGVASVCRGNEAVGSDLTTSEVIVWVILIHADSATIFPGAALDAPHNGKKNPRSGNRSGVCWEISCNGQHWFQSSPC